MPNKPLPNDDPLKGKKTGSWTKYGGAIHGLIKEKITEDWSCQLCGDTMPKEWSPFNFELYPKEFIRICNVCEKKTTRIKTKYKQVTIKTIINICRYED